MRGQRQNEKQVAGEEKYAEKQENTFSSFQLEGREKHDDNEECRKTEREGVLLILWY